MARRGQRAYGVLKVPPGSDAVKPAALFSTLILVPLVNVPSFEKLTPHLNRPLQEVIAPEAGIVMFIGAVPSLKKDDTMVNIGVVSTTPR